MRHHIGTGFVRDSLGFTGWTVRMYHVHYISWVPLLAAVAGLVTICFSHGQPAEDEKKGNTGYNQMPFTIITGTQARYDIH